MANEYVNSSQPESVELISIPTYLSNASLGVSLASTDCGECQAWGQSCGSSQYGSCSVCEGSESGSGGGGGGSCSTECEAGCLTGMCAGGQCGNCELGCMSSDTGAPTYSISDTSTTMTVTIHPTSQYHYFRIYYRLTSVSDVICYPSSTTYISSSSDYVWEKSGLSSGTSYTVNVRYASTSSSGGAFIGPQVFTTPSIEPWNWYASNGDASYSQTVAARNAVVNKTSTSEFSYLVWNDLCAKTLEAIHANDEYWNTTYAAYETTLMTEDDHVLTAKRFNSLRYNIGLRASTGINEVASGDIVYGSYFTTLATSLNIFIDTL